MSWQPIETAPKDETRILVATKAGRVYISAWVKKKDGFDAGSGYSWTTVGEERLAYWMPLPAPPNSEPIN